MNLYHIFLQLNAFYSVKKQHQSIDNKHCSMYSENNKNNTVMCIWFIEMLFVNVVVICLSYQNVLQLAINYRSTTQCEKLPVEESILANKKLWTKEWSEDV
ncbi:hypothetical protein C5G87_02275 [Paenibacillus peoriae]|nr:hypothetical protein C5G87_02275 [Paenibacillus peoriae]